MYDKGEKDSESNAVLWLQGLRTTVFEIKNAVVVIALFLKHDSLCGRMADSNYFYIEESIPCTWFVKSVYKCFYCWYMPLKIQEMLQLCISIPQRQFLLNLCQQNYLAWFYITIKSHTDIALSLPNNCSV